MVVAKLLLLGMVCTMGGVAAVYYSWKKHPQLKEAFLIAGWSLLLIAGLVWAEMDGWEFGSIYAITIPSLIALLFVTSNADYRQLASAAISRKSLAPLSTWQFAKHLKIFGLTVPFAMITSIFVSIGVSTLLPTSTLNQMVFAVCFFPFMWGLASSWLLTDSQLMRPILALAGLAALSLIPVNLIY